MKRWLNSALYAWQGLLLFFRTEPNGKIEFVITIITLGLGVWLHLAVWEWCLVLLCIGLLIAAEMLNTAIERLSNFITREKHPEIGAVKDIAAAAVMMVSIASFIIAILIFGPKIMHQLSLLGFRSLFS